MLKKTFRAIWRIFTIIVAIAAIVIPYEVVGLTPYEEDATFMMVVTTPRTGESFAAFKLEGEDKPATCLMSKGQKAPKVATLTLTKNRISGFILCTGFKAAKAPTPPTVSPKFIKQDIPVKNTPQKKKPPTTSKGFYTVV